METLKTFNQFSESVNEGYYSNNTLSNTSIQTYIEIGQAFQRFYGKLKKLFDKNDMLLSEPKLEKHSKFTYMCKLDVSDISLITDQSSDEFKNFVSTIKQARNITENTVFGKIIFHNPDLDDEDPYLSFGIR